MNGDKEVRALASAIKISGDSGFSALAEFGSKIRSLGFASLSWNLEFIETLSEATLATKLGRVREEATAKAVIVVELESSNYAIVSSGA